MGRPRMRVGAVTIASERGRAGELAEFYHRLLGWPITDSGPRGGWFQLRPPEDGIGPTINIEEERAYQRPVWPGEVGRPVAVMHLDIGVDALDEAVAWAVSVGAELAEQQPQPDVRVMIDPHGHPFCFS